MVHGKSEAKHSLAPIDQYANKAYKPHAPTPILNKGDSVAWPGFSRFNFLKEMHFGKGKPSRENLGRFRLCPIKPWLVIVFPMFRKRKPLWVRHVRCTSVGKFPLIPLPQGNRRGAAQRQRGLSRGHGVWRHPGEGWGGGGWGWGSIPKDFPRQGFTPGKLPKSCWWL